MNLSSNRAYRNANRGAGGAGGGWRRNPFVMFLAGIVVVWLLIALLGVLVRGLFFLTVLGLIFVIVTGMYGAFRLGRRS